MSSLRGLKNRIKSVKSTQKLTNAMKTVATSKYNAAGSRYNAFEEYYNSCKSMLSRLAAGSAKDGLIPRDQICSERKCYVLLTGNSGLCGSYNSDILKYMHSLLSKEAGAEKPLVIVCGEWGVSRFKNPKADIVTDFSFGDIPSYEQVEKLSLYLIGLWQKGLAGSIEFVYQKYRNTLTHEPHSEVFLPFEAPEEENDGEECIFLPAREEILERAVMLCLKAWVYEKLLSAAAGVQSATLTAMRTASDNSEEMLGLLELQMNRMRQASVTTEVIEVAGANANASEE